MNRRCAFIYSDSMAVHRFPTSHPMKPKRLQFTFDLLNEYHAFDPSNVILQNPREASIEDLLDFHSEDYINAVLAANNGEKSNRIEKFNFNDSDNPIYEGIYSAAALAVGASLQGVELLVTEDIDAVFSISGGLHHAMPNFASGFCVFNDAVIAIKKFLDHGKKVAYIDIDCHHGDGVQQAFYDTDRVLTISLHESGEFLFPGTGFAKECGVGSGKGYNINIPLHPFTTDEIYLWVVQEVVSPTVRLFKPDVLVTQLGVDSHFLDPITHLMLTVQGFSSIVQELALLSPGKWLLLGGGGYDVQAVSRSWVKAFGVMSGQEFDNAIPTNYSVRHRTKYLNDHPDSLVELGQKVIDNCKKFAEGSIEDIKRFNSLF